MINISLFRKICFHWKGGSHDHKALRRRSPFFLDHAHTHMRLWPPCHSLSATGCEWRSFTQPRVNSLLVFRCRICRPPKYRTQSVPRVGQFPSQFPIRSILKPDRVVVIGIPTQRTPFVTHGLDLFHRAWVIICGFPIPTDGAIHLHPHRLYPHCVNPSWIDIPPLYHETILENNHEIK